MSTTALHRMLDANLRLPPEYRSQLTNHLPMALHALAELGADAARLGTFFDHYAARFTGIEVPADPSAGAAPVEWTAWRARPDAYPPLRAHFAAALAQRSADAVLREALAALMPGVGGAAFHGLIRTAHAVQSGHRGELAAALAYWAWRWMPLEAPQAGPPLEVGDWTARLMAEAAGWEPAGGLISDRMQSARDAPAWRALAGRLDFGPATLRGLSLFAARRYAETGNFTVLHMVTACRAARVLLPWIDDASAAGTAIASAFVAAYLASGVGTGRTAAPPAADWQALIAGAIASDDDHVVKLVHACREEDALDAAEVYRQAAARALG